MGSQRVGHDWVTEQQDNRWMNAQIQVFLVLKLMSFFAILYVPTKRGENHSFPLLKRILRSFVTSWTPLHQWIGEAALERLASSSQSNITPGRRQLCSRTGQAELRWWATCRGERWPYFLSRQVNRGHSNSVMPRGARHSFTYRQWLSGESQVSPQKDYSGNLESVMGLELRLRKTQFAMKSFTLENSSSQRSHEIYMTRNIGIIFLLYWNK